MRRQFGNDVVYGEVAYHEENPRAAEAGKYGVRLEAPVGVRGHYEPLTYEEMIASVVAAESEARARELRRIVSRGECRSMAETLSKVEEWTRGRGLEQDTRQDMHQDEIDLPAWTFAPERTYLVWQKNNGVVSSEDISHETHVPLISRKNGKYDTRARYALVHGAPPGRAAGWYFLDFGLTVLQLEAATAAPLQPEPIRIDRPLGFGRGSQRDDDPHVSHVDGNHGDG